MLPITQQIYPVSELFLFGNTDTNNSEIGIIRFFIIRETTEGNPA